MRTPEELPKSDVFPPEVVAQLCEQVDALPPLPPENLRRLAELFAQWDIERAERAVRDRLTHETTAAAAAPTTALRPAAGR
jgi:hypothetical protein